jgi:hypothetical protein
MKIRQKYFFHKLNSGLGRRNESGSATVVFIALLAIMCILITANGNALFRLHREVKFLEQQQIKRLNASQTNIVSAAKPNSQ